MAMRNPPYPGGIVRRQCLESLELSAPRRLRGQQGRNCDGWRETLVLIFVLIKKDHLAAASPKSD